MAEFLPFEAKLARAWPPERWSELTTLVGLSGGADSVALLRALCRIRGGVTGRIVAAHFNHGWRGAESEEDEQFCWRLAESLGVECLVGGISPIHGRPKTEEAARKDRYAFFRQASEQIGARYLVLGHHRDDQVETVIQRLIRGTSLRGLAGIPRVRRFSELTTIVRPLLSCSRSAIEKYLRALKQPYRTDSTNANRAWLRNRIRGELIPLLEADYAPQARLLIARLASEAAEATDYLDGLAEAAMDKVAKLDFTAGTATLTNFEALNPYLLRLVLIQIWRFMGWPEGEMTRHHWRKLAESLTSQKNGSLGQYPGAIHVIVHDDVATILRR